MLQNLKGQVKSDKLNISVARLIGEGIEIASFLLLLHFHHFLSHSMSADLQKFNPKDIIYFAFNTGAIASYDDIANFMKHSPSSEAISF
jgi:hypothetical protein